MQRLQVARQAASIDELDLRLDGEIHREVVTVGSGDAVP